MKITKYKKAIYACGNTKIFGAWQTPKIECPFCHAPIVTIEIIEETINRKVER